MHALSECRLDGVACCRCCTSNTPAKRIHRPSYGGNYGDAAQDWYGHIV